MERKIINLLCCFLALMQFLLYSCSNNEGCSDLRSLKYGRCNNTKTIKRVNGYIFTVFYIPEDIQRDKSRDDKQKSLHFCLRIDPDTAVRKKFDVVTDRAKNVESLIERIEKLNFSFEHSIELQIGKGKYFPSLTNMENTYSIEEGRLVHLYFVGDGSLFGNNQSNKEEIRLVWEDAIYGTGKNIFIIPFEEIKILHNKVNEFYENTQKTH